MVQGDDAMPSTFRELSKKAWYWKQHQKGYLKHEITNDLNERNHGKIHGYDSNNLIKATIPCGRAQYFHLESQWKALGHKRKLKDLAKGSTLQGVQGYTMEIIRKMMQRVILESATWSKQDFGYQRQIWLDYE
jgi:hypothetical protein